MRGMRPLHFVRPFLAAASLVIVASAADAGLVSGVVRTAVAPGARPATAVVYAEPVDAAPPRRAGNLTLRQKNKTFQPSVLAIPSGSTVDFPNDDAIFHNVFSLSGPQPFDLGLYRGGASRSRTFTSPAAYRVFCNIHPQMTALIVVVPTPFVTLADGAGRYTLDLPPGRYRLTALSDRAAAVTADITSIAGAVAAPELQLDESRFISVAHKNKHGQDYPAESYKH
jgi:plastocyanin